MGVKSVLNSEMSEQEIVKYNIYIRERHDAIDKEIQALKDMKEYINPVSPCHFCRYEGVYKCEQCKEEFFAGFKGLI